MNLIERMLDNISQKQEETTSNLEQAFRRLLSSNGKDFMTKLADKLTDHFEESLSKHSNKIGLFLFSQNANNEQFLIQEQQPISINVLPQQKNPQTEKHIEAKINVQNVASNEQSKKRKEIIEKEKGIDQNPELKNEYNNKKNKQLQFLEQSNPSQQFTNQKIIEANNDKKSKNFSIKQKDRTPSLHHKQLATNGKLGKSNSRKNGQSRKSFQEENFKSRGKSYKQKSRKMRTNLIKLAPIAQAKQRQTKRKEANERIQAALEFLNSLPNKKNAISFSPTQWKQQKSEKFILSKNNSSMSPNSIKLKELSQKSRLQKSRKLESNILQMSDFSPKQHRMQKRDRFSLQKPQAYNLYNINMLKHEVFQLRVSD